MNLNPGDILRNMRIIRFIPGGGMGKVYEAEDELLGRRLAIKQLERKDLQQRFIHEAQILSKLKHPNVVELYNLFTEGEDYFMTMEYVDGVTLKELIANTGPIPEQRARKLLTQILLALRYAHDKGVIHRDIKPSNLMVSGDDELKVLDFGIARMTGLSQLTSTGSRLGTPFYMSPEQIRTPNAVDHRTDIFSTGVVLFEMLTRSLPFNASTESNFLLEKEIVESPVPNPRDFYPYISDVLVNLVFAMTAKHPADRPEIPQILDSLKTGSLIELKPEPEPRQTQPSAPPEQPVQIVIPRRRKRPGLVAFLIILALLLLGGGGFVLNDYLQNGYLTVFDWLQPRQKEASDEEKAKALASDEDYNALMEEFPDSRIARELLTEDGSTQYRELQFMPLSANRSFTYAHFANYGPNAKDSYTDPYNLQTGSHFSRLVNKQGDWVIGDILPYSGSPKLLADLERLCLGPAASQNQGLHGLGGLHEPQSQAARFSPSCNCFIQVGSDVYLGYKEDEVYKTKYLIYSADKQVKLGPLTCDRNYIEQGEETGRYFGEIYWRMGYGNVSNYWKGKLKYEPLIPEQLLGYDAINRLPANQSLLRNQTFYETRTVYDEYWDEYREDQNEVNLYGTNGFYQWAIIYGSGYGLYVLTTDAFTSQRVSSAYILVSTEFLK